MKRRKINSRGLSMITFVLSLLLLMPNLKNTFASGDTYEISNVAELAYASILSKTEGHQGDTFILMNDITITDEDYTNLADNDVKAITFGSSDYPFTGTFEGNGHTISNLKYSTGLAVSYDTGLFAQTNGATIRNLIIDNASIRADYRGGIVVGYANNTTIVNVTVKNSHMAVTAADNVVTLVTDGGVRSGVIAGEAVNSIIYNCESENNAVTNNNTSGVAALAGKGLTLGGLVGTANATDIEYSRVYGGRVSNSYDVAVGAVGGNTLYVGGIVGKMQNGSRVIDSFSTAELYYYCATYVSVGAGNVGHIGGIAAQMNGNSNEIIRSHYAGTATSRQYNAALVIPIIQNNVNISGIVDDYDGGSVVNSYFKPSMNPNVNMKVLGNSDSTSSYGPVNDENYASKEYWQDVYYDFSGNIRRNTKYSNNHYNKWVMDTNLGIPVHGKSIAATLDFPGAGEVVIKPTVLMNHNVSTTNPYYFAVQGMKIHEYTASVEARVNSGYRFVSWYKVPNVTAWSLEQNHSYFDEVFSKYQSVSNSSVLNDISVEDNNLFVGYYQARVVFHDVNGNMIDTNGDSSNSNDNDWYDYEDELPSVTPTNTPSSSSARLIGWTTVSNNGAGYASISTPELASIKNSNEFYEAGDLITKTLDLYPIYVDLTSNIHLVFEGNEQDTSGNVSERDGVGSLSLIQNGDDIAISVNGSDNGNLPDGYRFLGWYNSDGIRVSRDMNYTLPSNINLSNTQTYTARFEYRVDYYVRAFSQDDNAFSTSIVFATRWMRYNDDFESIPSPGYLREYITHWGESHVNHGETDNNSDAFTGKITSPKNVYSHNYTTANNGKTGYQVSMTTSFPASGQITPEYRLNGSYFKFTHVDDRYHLLFWTLENTAASRANGNSWTYSDNRMDSGPLGTTSSYYYEGSAIVTGDIVFYKRDNSTVTVTRKYNDKVFNTEQSYTYKYPFKFTDTDIATTTSDSPTKHTINKTYTFGASPTNNEMKINDYAFLGWVSSNDIDVNSTEWNYIYNVNNDSYCSSDIHRSKPYLVDQNSLQVDEIMDLYPVYAKYNISSTTNVPVINISGVNRPNDPTLTFVESEVGSGTVTIVPDTNVRVKDGEDAIYTLYSVTVIRNKGREEVIYPDSNGNYTYDIEAGPTYEFVAKYEPYIVIYHLNDNDISVFAKNRGDAIGVMPDPTYNINNIGTNVIFAGYTKEEPSSGYHFFNSYSDYESSSVRVIPTSTLITESLELWPVYIESTISVNSNIDSLLISDGVDKSTIYNLDREDLDTLSVNILEEDYNIYHFIGWYDDYVDDNDYGTLVSNNLKYILSSSECYSNNTLTAVFKRAYQINYYDTDKNLLETVYVRGDLSRNFVTTKLDNNNNEVESFIDYDVILDLYDILDDNEILNGFNWVKSDNSIVYWDDFKDEVIYCDMDIYPSITKITVFNSNDNLISNNITYGNSNDIILVGLKNTYSESKLTVHVEDINYHPVSDIINNVTDKEVNLSTTGVFDDYDYTENTNSSGNAIFYLYQDVTIRTNVIEGREDDIFIFDIVDSNSNIIQKVTVPCGDSTIVKLPYGSYSILEESKWSWRYSSYSINYTVNNVSNNIIDVNNRETNRRWFSDVKLRKNLFN